MDTIEEKLRKLEAMMADDGASDGEKENALRLFERLVKNYNVDLSKRKVSDIIEHHSKIAFTPDSWNQTYHSIMSTYTTYFNVYTVRHMQKEPPFMFYFIYYGKEDDIIMLDYMYTMTIRKFQSLFRFKLFSKNKDGILGEFVVELRKIVESKIRERNNYFNSSSNGQEIILVRKNDITLFKEEYTKKYGGTSHSNSHITTNGAKGVGASIAKGINFNRPVGAGQSTKQLN